MVDLRPVDERVAIDPFMAFGLPFERGIPAPEPSDYSSALCARSGFPQKRWSKTKS